MHKHHRKLRSQGGGDEPANIMYVTPEFHDYIHAHPAESYANGWLVKGWDTDFNQPCRGYKLFDTLTDDKDGFGWYKTEALSASQSVPVAGEPSETGAEGTEPPAKSPRLEEGAGKTPAPSTSKQERAWAAGFFDGEGSTSVAKSKWKKSPEEERQYQSPIIQITQHNRETLERFQKAMGLIGTVRGPFPSGGIAGNELKRYQFAAHGEEAQSALSLMWPWLSPPKKEQAETVIGKVNDHQDATGSEKKYELGKKRATLGIRLPKDADENGIEVLDTLIDACRKELMDEMGWTESVPAYYVLTGVLHDWLTSDRSIPVPSDED